MDCYLFKYFRRLLLQINNVYFDDEKSEFLLEPQKNSELNSILACQPILNSTSEMTTQTFTIQLEVGFFISFRSVRNKFIKI